MLQNTGTIEARDLTPAEVAAQPHRCQHCGYVSTTVVQKSVHVGGHASYVTRYYCQDETACWRRWDRCNGMVM